jgi:N-acetylglucosaminyldiphosphoundecaprenol N-acetyl-beta-D-mannosaminyltransferase
MEVGRLSIDRLTFDEALAQIAVLVDRQLGGIVFTPNVDHIVMASESARFRRAYAAADLSLADGQPVVWASRLLGHPVPEKISGSDLAPRLMGLAEARGFRVYLLGGGQGVAAAAARRLRQQHPRLAIVGSASPRIDLREPAATRAAIVRAIQDARPDLVLVALGAPKQELWIHQVAGELRPAVLLGIGASIDFIAGTARRAPAWLSAIGLEWFYRLLHEPRRLWRRYLVRDSRFFGIVFGGMRVRRSLRARAPELGP